MNYMSHYSKKLAILKNRRWIKTIMIFSVLCAVVLITGTHHAAADGSTCSSPYPADNCGYFNSNQPAGQQEP